MDRQGTCEIPFTSTRDERRNRNRRLITVPGPRSVLRAHRERFGEHETGGVCGACDRNHKGPGMREREVVAPS